MEILILLALVLLNGVFAMSEVALLTARRSRLKQLAAGGDALAAAALRLADDPTRFLSTVQIGITSVSILNGIIGDAQVMDAQTLPKVRMPNRDGFVPDSRPDVPLKPRP